MIKDYAIIALKNLKKEKLRSFLTLIGILISIATIFILIALSVSLEKAVNEQFRLLGTDKLFVQPRGQIAGIAGGTVELTKKDVDVIKKVSGIKEVSGWVFANAKIQYKEEVRFVRVVGVDLDTSNLFEETGAYELDEGRFLKKGDKNVVIVGSQYKYNKFFKQPLHLSDKIKINDKEFKIKGIFKTVGNPEEDRLIYMPQEDFRELFNIPERVDVIVVQISPGEDIEKAAKRIEKELIKARQLDKNNIDFTILTPSELIATFGNVLSIITGFLVAIAAISLLVGGIGIANTMFTSVLERTKEIGVMKAIGAKNSEIFLIFVIEAGFLGIIGGISGILFGTIISKLIEYYAVTQLGITLLKISIPLNLIFSLLIFSFVVGAISGFWPARRATKIKPIEALRYE